MVLLIGVTLLLMFAFGGLSAPTIGLRVGWLVACGSTAVGLSLPRLFSAKRTRQVAVGFVIAMLSSFLAASALSLSLGGRALEGGRDESGYFLKSGRATTTVSPLGYGFAAVVELSVFASWPAGFVLGAWLERSKASAQETT